MTPFTISTAATAEAVFYIQLKGNNAGKPLNISIANSAAVTIDKSVLLDKYFYYVIDFLFNSGAFKAYLKGSIIPYLRIKDIEKVIIDFFNKQR